MKKKHTKAYTIYVGKDIKIITGSDEEEEVLDVCLVRRDKK